MLKGQSAKGILQGVYMKWSFLIILACLQFNANASLAVGNRFKKVIWVVFENTNYKEALKQPDFANAAKLGALFTNLKAEDHPSQGNYIAMIAGSRHGVGNDNSTDIDGSHLGDLLEKSGRDWRVYAEDYPGNCFTGKKSGNYVRKHNPFMSFLNVTRDPQRCAKIESSEHFDQDFAGNNLPDYSMYIPDMNNDGHDTGIKYAGKYLRERFGKIMTSVRDSSDLLMVITFDESNMFDSSNKIFTVIIGGSVVPGSKYNESADHVALLKLIEEEFSLGSLGTTEEVSSPLITGIWK